MGGGCGYGALLGKCAAERAAVPAVAGAVVAGQHAFTTVGEGEKFRTV